MPIVPYLHQPRYNGLVKILVAFPKWAYALPHFPFEAGQERGVLPANHDVAYQQLWVLGESEEHAEPTFHHLLSDVKTGRHGGSKGPPVDYQFMGQIAEINLQLSSFDARVFSMLETFCGLMPFNSLSNIDIGEFCLRDYSFRLVMATGRQPLPYYSPQAPGPPSFFYKNFPCCILHPSWSLTQGTKYSLLTCKVVAYRTPETHWSDPEGFAPASRSIGVICNNDLTGSDFLIPFEPNSVPGYL